MLMPSMPGSFAELLGAFRACFTAPTFTTFTALCAGLLAQPGPGTVCGMLAGARLDGLLQPACRVVRPQRARRRRCRRPPRLGALVSPQADPVQLDMLMAFRRAMLAEYQRTHQLSPPARNSSTRC
jgi:hypothetical protein